MPVAEQSASRRLLTVLLVLASVNVILFVAQRYLVTPLRVPSSSMQPALEVGDRILVRRTHESPNELAAKLDRGDVLVFRAPESGRPLVVKRVIGLPGETIEARDGVIAINDDRVLVEKWLEESERAGAAAATVDVPRRTLADDEVFVLGDNRDASTDSRAFGPIQLDDVVGTVAVRFWPPKRFGTVDWT